MVAVGARTFVLNQGTWTDTAFDPGKMKTIKVPFLSQDYFRLGEGRAEVAAALALGSRVIVMVDGSPYEIVEDE